MAVAKRKRVTKKTPPEAEGDLPLTAAQRRADARHLKDTEDRTRYLLVSLTVPGFSLYYRVQDDEWFFDDPMQATLLKRQPAAKAIQALLRTGVHIVPCKVDEDGVPDELAVAPLCCCGIGRLVPAIAGRRSVPVCLTVRQGLVERMR